MKIRLKVCLATAPYQKQGKQNHVKDKEHLPHRKKTSVTNFLPPSFLPKEASSSHHTEPPMMLQRSGAYLWGTCLVPPFQNEKRIYTYIIEY